MWHEEGENDQGEDRVDVHGELERREVEPCENGKETEEPGCFVEDCYKGYDFDAGSEGHEM